MRIPRRIGDNTIYIKQEAAASKLLVAMLMPTEVYDILFKKSIQKKNNTR